ncbi:MAG: DUF115 domain-containing protein [Treponema sp.]|jgi:hypothetical protein|nr:DUF115 domain-containing protein [Treponema sp.]
MSGLLPANASVLGRNYPGLAEELAKEDEAGELAPEDLKTENAATGEPVLVVRGIHVHSPRDPVREAKRLAEAALGVCSPEASAAGQVLVVMGFGLGYAAEAAASAAPGRPVIIVERRRELLRKALEIRDLGDFLSQNRLVFVLGGSGDAVSGALALFEKPGEKTVPLIIRNRALAGLDGDWYGAVEKRIQTWLSKDNVNRATLKRFGKRWVRNLSRNLESIRDLPGVGRLENILKGPAIPVFLAAAGPSLDETGPFLAEIAGRCLVVAVDTSLRFLIHRGVDPDFVVSVDPQYWNFRHLDRLPAPNTRLVAESAVYPPCLRHRFKGRLLCGSLFPLGRFIEERVDPKGELGAGGSVATTAWDFARVLGAPAVWIAGLDLSFPDLKTHFSGALFEDRSLAESARFKPGETWGFRSLRDGQPFWAKSPDGGEVLTDKRLSLYAAWFENRFRRFPKPANYGLSAKGLAIGGLKTATIDELLALPERREEINSLLEEVFAKIEGEFERPEQKKARSEAYDTALAALLEGLKEIKTLARDAAETAETALRRHARLKPREQERVLQKLDAANKAVSASAVKDVAGFLFPDPDELEKSVKTPPRESFAYHLEFSARFYRALAEAAGYNLSTLEGNHAEPLVRPHGQHGLFV